MIGQQIHEGTSYKTRLGPGPSQPASSNSIDGNHNF